MNRSGGLNDLSDIFDPSLYRKKPLVIAGPCSAESCDQTLRAAEGVSSCGIKIFRAGIWKPRTKPGGFEGVGEEGLPWLIEAKKRYGVEPLIEIATREHLKIALDYGITSFWTGARTTANPFAIQLIADEISGLDTSISSKITVLVKNPVNPDIDLWIGALERLYAGGVRKLGAIHRGFSAYGEHVYRNRPEWSIPLELRHRFPSLPLICDPSHIAGRKDLVFPIAQQAMDLNFDGLMIEVHPKPEDALSDGGQQITINELSGFLKELKVRDGDTPEENLRVFREEIDRIDNELISLLSERMEVSRQIGVLKKKINMPVWQSDRYDSLMSRFLKESERLKLSPEFIQKILSLIHEESVRAQI